MKKRKGMNAVLVSMIIIAVILVGGLIIGLNIFVFGNTNTLVSECATACETNSKYDYCTKVRTLKDGQTEIETSCATFSVISAYEKYGIEECPLIECDFECISIMGNGVIRTECTNNEDDVTSIADVISGQRCCVPKIVS